MSKPIIAPSLLSAQSYANKTLITIGDKEIPVKEFMSTYEKNNVNTDVIDKKNVDEYLDLYVDFKLKVAEADMGMIVGKHGKIARALRTVTKAAAKMADKKVTVEIR